MPSIDKSFITNHTCFRIRDPKVTVPFYEKHFGMKLISRFELDRCTLYMMGYSTIETLNWAAIPGILKMRHDNGVENDPDFQLNNGNGEKFRGFGHICISVDNIVECEKKLLADGVQFKKKLTDGQQRNIAFALDPNGYWVELIEHSQGKTEAKTDTSTYKLNHTMIRVKDYVESLKFYREVLGMKLFRKLEFPESKFTLYFLGYDHSDIKEGELDEVTVASKEGVIELTHNWGTENDDSFEGYHNGNSTGNGAIQGYSHISVTCDDPAKFCSEIDAEFGYSVNWSVQSNKGVVPGIACISDPDGYLVEILRKQMFSE
ncbi:glyoxalase I [Metschnikowia bicuspidata]|uniref:Lactoylglutathione lyase n=1 Tax=Metschnikowia bicuspidata TaxID=27322 RepID=A0A4P9ZBD4_9ASCO|nr:glyoxalase I [Metschnikowia bicuspidata]RKP29120.1 glyoxalase I [Metschnikowia bicuspidata]